MKPTLSIIILSYNTAKITVSCLNSINHDQGLMQIPTEIIVIDNASTDTSVTELKKIKNIKLICNSKNKGFAAANNQGAKVAQGNYLLFLNSDTIILHWGISQCLTWLSSHPESIACSAQLLFKDGTVQPTGGFFPSLLNVFTWSTGFDDLPLTNKIIKPFHPHSPHFYTHDTFYLHNQKLDWVTGAFIMMRQQAFAATQGFDETYFMYAEEVEWFYRIKKQFPNHTVNYLIGPQITHLGGASSPNKEQAITSEYLGIIKFFAKHKGPIQTKIVKILLKSNAMLRSIIYQLKGNHQIANFYQNACSKI